MKSKHWLKIFFAIAIIGIACFMGLNYYVDPMEYFTVKKGETEFRSDQYSRAVKSEYVMKNKDSIDAVILGGSKAGALSTELLTEYTGKRYYNFSSNVGNFSDYYKYGKFLIDSAGISEITLHLSSFEVDYFTKEGTADNFKIPAVVSGGKLAQITEFLNYLMTDINTTIDGIKKMIKNNPMTLDTLATGERNWVRYLRKFPKNPEKYINKYVLKNYTKYLAGLFKQEASSQPAYDDNIQALQELKDYCDAHGVTLKVVIGASFIAERNSYECDRYYEYLRQIVDITDVWDFSDFNDVNLNPYNFFNRRHFNYNVANLMVNTMYGTDSHEGFGIYLTKDNIDEYLANRKASFETLKAEFDATGTVALKDMTDSSYIY